MDKDIETYLRELQAAMASAGADPALMQDALFDAEEHLQAEMAAGGEFATVAEGYGTPEEVAAAYMGVAPATGGALGTGAVATVEEAPGTGAAVVADAVPALAAEPIAEAQPVVETLAADEATAVREVPAATEAPVAPGRPVGPTPPTPPAPPTPPVAPGWAPAPQYGQQYVPTPAGVQAGMAAAAAGGAAPPSVWWQIFGVFADSRIYKALIYMLLSLGTGIAYFTIVVTGVSTAGGMLVLIVGLPLFVLVLGIVRGIALLEGRLVEVLLGTRMPRRLRSDPPGAGFFQRMWFWVKDGRTWASMAYMILMLPLGIVYFTVTVTGIATGLGLITTPLWGWFGSLGDHTFIINGVPHDWWFPVWGIPIAFIVGVIVLTGTMHLIRWMGRGHAAFAKAMLVRLAK